MRKKKAKPSRRRKVNTSQHFLLLKKLNTLCSTLLGRGERIVLLTRRAQGRTVFETSPALLSAPPPPSSSAGTESSSGIPLKCRSDCVSVVIFSNSAEKAASSKVSSAASKVLSDFSYL